MANRGELAEMLKTGDVAALTHSAPQTVRNWADSGKLPALITPSGHRRFRRADVEALLRSFSTAAK